MPSRHSVFILLCIAMTTLAGCRVRDGIRRVRDMQSPLVEVVAVRVAERTSEGARLEVHVRLDNPNAEILPLMAASYRVSVDGVSAASASNKPNRTLPASGSQMLILPIALATDAGIASGTPVRTSGSITYNPPGEIRMLMTESKVPLPVATFSYEGVIE